MKRKKPQYTFALAGVPNVGKSTLFNALTGLRQHTGNWIGKTVETAQGMCQQNGKTYRLVDLPGTYSLSPHSEEERVARDYILQNAPDAVIVVCDAGNLARSLRLVGNILQITSHVCVALHLSEEAEKCGVGVDIRALGQLLGVSVVRVNARKKTGLAELMEKAEQAAGKEAVPPGRTAREIAQCVQTHVPYKEKRVNIDDILMHRRLGTALMLLLLCGVLLLTVFGANKPSEWLGRGLFALQDVLEHVLSTLHCPPVVRQMLVFGVYRTLAWVLSVMLPPMAIFFPLFTLLEDCGYLPRAAFRLDRSLYRCHACGKQALTMCMGLGCNAAAVVSCRIMDSPRERQLAILTNAFLPCNGRFPMLLAVLTMFISGGLFANVRTAVMLCGCIVLGVLMTFAATLLLSKTVLRGMPSAFTLELPPYRKPQIGQVIVRSVLDRTLRTAGRAAAVTAPAGMFIWLAANVRIGDNAILQSIINILQPIGQCMGLDGVILTGFLLAFPANEIVLPAILLGYTAQGSMTPYTDLTSLRDLLISNGWTTETAVCFLLLALFHAPCATTVWTIRKETGSGRRTLIAVLLPSVCGVLLCMAVHAFSLLL